MATRIKILSIRRQSLSSLIRLLALCAMALGACAAPTAVPPTAVPTQPPKATALPPAAAATPQSTAAPLNVPIPATSIQLPGPGDFAFDVDNNFYVSECGPQQRIYKIDPFGLLTIYAGAHTVNFSSAFTGDGGPARSADLACPAGLAFDRDDNLYVADSGNNRVRRIDRNGLINTVAGSGPSNGNPSDFSGDGGPASAAHLNSPSGIAFDPAGNLYISDAGNNRIRKMDQAGIITTVAGTGASGFSGDGGPATAAELNLSSAGFFVGIAIDGQGNLYIAEPYNARVRKVDQQGIITTIAGTGEPVVSGDGGPATSAALSRPTGLAFDASGNLYIACTASSFASDARIRKIDGRGIITTVAGAGPVGRAELAQRHRLRPPREPLPRRSGQPARPQD